MRYSDTKLREALAGEYVLGTLRGRARRRFERLMAEDATLRAEVAQWSQRLAPLDQAIAPVNPPAWMWPTIQQRLGVKRPQSLWQRLTFWRGLSFVSSFAAMLLAVTLVVQIQKPETPSRIALISDAQAKPLWLVYAHAARLNMKVVAPPTLAAGRSYELWMLPRGGQPVSLGLLPLAGESALPLTHEREAVLEHAEGLAVSLEPSGGSPTGQPTGPVLFQGTLLAS